VYGNPLKFARCHVCKFYPKKNRRAVNEVAVPAAAGLAHQPHQQNLYKKQPDK
jgi:hypothetical protein